jgi:hypothetical protein
VARSSIAAALLTVACLWGGTSGAAQSLDDLNLEVHGYATQGFIYTTNNNWNTIQTSDGSAAWTEAVVTVTARPQGKLRVGLQARYFLLGNYGNAISLDWAEADYKVSEHFGVRAGRVKTPSSLWNEIQDIDPAYLWILLPQSIYPIASRNSNLAHDGGVVYGSMHLGPKMGRWDYRGFGGATVLAGDDGYFQTFLDMGFTIPNGVVGPVYGASLRWQAPAIGLTAGASGEAQSSSSEIANGPLQGTLNFPRFYTPFFFARYEHGPVMLAGEYSRTQLRPTVRLAGIPEIDIRVDKRGYYGMATYRVLSKLDTGIYYSYSINYEFPVSSGRYQKDWTLAARYDINPYIYLKFDQHFMDGTLIGYSAMDNAGLRSNTRMTLLKVGASF